jgi:hypothetical protein
MVVRGATLGRTRILVKQRWIGQGGVPGTEITAYRIDVGQIRRFPLMVPSPPTHGTLAAAAAVTAGAGVTMRTAGTGSTPATAGARVAMSAGGHQRSI